jgi:hypothetical protein
MRSRLNRRAQGEDGAVAVGKFLFQFFNVIHGALRATVSLRIFREVRGQFQVDWTQAVFIVGKAFHFDNSPISQTIARVISESVLSLPVIDTQRA